MSSFSAIEEDREADSERFTADGTPQPTWCPGCGDFAVLKALSQALAELGRTPDETFLATGIGCSGKLSNFLNTYGYHAIHGRALPVARGAKLANPGLEVIAAGGDGDGYGIGANHFMHSARENHDITYVVFNNEIFGLTKGQTSPTSPKGHTSKTQPNGSAKDPVRPLSLSLSSGASYIARTSATNPRQAGEILAEAIDHDGFAHVDFLTQCPTWNKDAKEYVPFTDVQDAEEFDVDVTDRGEAAALMQRAESRLHEGEILTGRFYRAEGRPAYGQEKRRVGDQPEQPVAERYGDDSVEWERTRDDLIEDHT